MGGETFLLFADCSTSTAMRRRGSKKYDEIPSLVAVSGSIKGGALPTVSKHLSVLGLQSEVWCWSPGDSTNDAGSLQASLSAVSLSVAVGTVGVANGLVSNPSVAAGLEKAAPAEMYVEDQKPARPREGRLT